MQLCQQRDRTFDGLAGQLIIAGTLQASERCGHASDGITLTPPAIGMAAGVSGSVSLQTASGEAHIERAILWHDSVVDGHGLQLSLEATTAAQTRVLRSTAVGSGTLGGADHAPIGPTATGFDFSEAPVQRLSYVLRCAGPGACPGGPGAARLQLYGTELTIGDPVAPALSVGSWPTSDVKGTFDIGYGAQDDESGVRQVIVYADDRGLASADADCDWRQIRPCPQRLDGSLSVDTSTLRDDVHAFIVRSVDGAGNVRDSARTYLYVSNQPNSERPTNAMPPAITVSDEVPRSGDTLNASTGVWRPTSGVTYQYGWARCSASGSCTTVVGAEDSRYILTDQDVGQRLELTVTASNARGVPGVPAKAASALIQKSALRNRLLPDISGVLALGKRVIASPGNWDGGPIGFTYRWLACAKGKPCRAVTRPTALPTYAIRAADESRTLVVEVTARAKTGAPVKARSAPVGPVRVASAVRELLPRPYLHPLLEVVSLAGDVSYRLRSISIGALRRGSNVDVSCSGKCTDFVVRRRVRSSPVTLELKPSAELLPGAKVVIRVRHPGFVGRIRRITLGHAGLSYSPMRCLQPRTDREVACSSR